MKHPLVAWKEIILVTLHLILAIQQSSSTCYNENHYGVFFVYCTDLNSFNEIPAHLYESHKVLFFIRNSRIALSEAKSFNATNMYQLDITSSDISSVEPRFFEDFPRLSQLTIRGSHVDHMDAFPQIKSLDRMELIGNTIRYMPTNLFHNLVDLDGLLFEYNQMLETEDNSHGKDKLFFSISNFPSNLFVNASVTYMFLNGNGIASLKEDTFTGLNKLHTLHIKNNTLSVLPTGIFQDLASLKDLNLNSNKIKNLDMPIFTQSLNLERFILSNNQLTDVKSDWFVNVPALKTLDLGANNIEHFDIRLNNLTVLILSKNQLKNIDQNAFEKVPSLVNLDLSHNKIVNVSSDAFKGLTDLQTLNLEYNQISNLHKDVWRYFLNLTTVKLSGNKITNLSKVEFDHFKSLLKLDLSNNKIETIKSGAFEKLVSLEELDLANTQLTNIDQGIFIGLENLKFLNLSSNKIEKLKPGIFEKLELLEDLNLDNTHLTEIKSDIFKDLKNLTKLYLENNKITSLSLSVFHGLKITDLSLKGNKIKDFDSNTNQSTIMALNLEATSIQSLEVVKHLPVLRYLYLVGTKFENESRITVDDRPFSRINKEAWEVFRDVEYYTDS